MRFLFLFLMLGAGAASVNSAVAVAGWTAERSGPPAAVVSAGIDSGADSVFLFSYFKGNGEDGLHLAVSSDGYQFRALNKDRSILTPTAGGDKLMRDPCIIRGANGGFHMVWTVSWEERGIGYAYSEDLVNWSEQQYIPVMEHEPAAMNCWAPELNYDPSTGQYIIYWATTIPGRFSEPGQNEDDHDHRIYYTLTKDFKQFSKTELLYDRGFNVIDATIKKHGNDFIMFLKNETLVPPEKNIRIASAKAITGPYSTAGPAITGDYWAEGPTVTRVDDKWIVYFDKYRERVMGAIASADLENWEDISAQVHFPEGTRHGTVLKISAEEFDYLKKRFIE